MVLRVASVNVNGSVGRGREEIRKFWNDVNECQRSFERESRIVLIRHECKNWQE